MAAKVVKRPPRGKKAAPADQLAPKAKNLPKNVVKSKKETTTKKNLGDTKRLKPKNGL